MEDCERISIPAEALVDWKQQCEADKCEPDHRDALIKGAYLAWRKYTQKKWNEEFQIKGVVYKQCFSSDIKDMFLEQGKNKGKKNNGEEGGDGETKKEDGKTNPYPFNTPHPFHAIETTLYQQKRKNGEPLKSWLLANEKAKSAGWLIKVLFQEVLFRKFIKKQEKIAEYNESLDREDCPELPDRAAEEKLPSEQKYIQEKIRTILESIPEKHKVACYYRLKGSRDADYELTVEEIYQIVGVKKVFYDYTLLLLKECVPQLKEDGFEDSEIYSELWPLIYQWASTNEICKALDAKVAEKKAKKNKNASEKADFSNS